MRFARSNPVTTMLGSRSEADLLRLAASLESQSEHPIAAGIVGGAKERSIEFPVPAEFRAIPGKGAEATVEGTRVKVVSPGFPRFRCHAGHAYAGASLLFALRENADDSISSALRTSQASAMLMREMAAHLNTHRDSRAAAEEALAAAD